MLPPELDKYLLKRKEQYKFEVSLTIISEKNINKNQEKYH